MKNLLNSDIVGINGDDGKTKFFNDNVISTIAKGPRKGVRPRQVFVIDAMQFPISESTRVRCLKGDNCIKKKLKKLGLAKNNKSVWSCCNIFGILVEVEGGNFSGLGWASEAILGRKGHGPVYCVR